MNNKHSPLVGSWKLTIARSQAGLPPFLALHTYFADGTMTETTSVMGKVTEGPGHGIWRSAGEEFASAFELFSFDESGEYTATVRVRVTIRLDGSDQIRGETAVDVFPLDGEPQLNADSAPFVGTRIKPF
ncbi:MAG: hypothetical protein IPM53_03795 [Anaerolineaceae bacterium]|nr:hypothetical protein [Anaerolineaceae bacterium]